MKRTLALAGCLAVLGIGAAAAQADDDPPVMTDSPLVQCSPDVCQFSLVPPPELGADLGFFEGLTDGR